MDRKTKKRGPGLGENNTQKEINRICEGLLSTFQFWDDRIGKDKYREQLQTCFRLAL